MRAAVGVCSVLLLVAPACGARSAPPAPPRADRATMTVDESIAMLVEVGAVVMSAGADCGRMAAGVGRWLDGNGDRRKRVNAELLRIRSPEIEDLYRSRLAEHLDVVQAMRVGVEGCQDDPRFMRAWSRLDE